MTTETPETPAQKPRRRVISVIVDNEPGVLARVVGMFSGKGVNIGSFTVAEVASSEYNDSRDGVARMTVVTDATDPETETIVNRISTIVLVRFVKDITDDPDKVEADITIVKALTDDPAKQTQIAVMGQTQFRALSVRTRPTFVAMRFVGQAGASKDFVDAVKRYGVGVEVAHSGIIALA